MTYGLADTADLVLIYLCFSPQTQYSNTVASGNEDAKTSHILLALWPIIYEYTSLVYSLLQIGLS